MHSVFGKINYGGLKHNSVYLGLVLPSGGWQNLIVSQFVCCHKSSSLQQSLKIFSPKRIWSSWRRRNNLLVVWSPLKGFRPWCGPVSHKQDPENDMSRGRCYKLWRTHSLRKMDSFHNKLVSPLFSVTFTGWDKHPSLQAYSIIFAVLALELYITRN